MEKLLCFFRWKGPFQGELLTVRHDNDIAGAFPIKSQDMTVTESHQNCMAQAGSNCPAQCPLGFEGLQGWRCHSYCEQPVPVLQSSNSEFISYDLMEFSIFRFVPPVLSLDITVWFQALTHIACIPWSFPFRA